MSNFVDTRIGAATKSVMDTLLPNNNPRSQLPLTPAVFAIFLALVNREQHGYAINRGQQLSAIDTTTGDILYSERIPYDRGGQLYGSFSLAGGHLFVGHDNGQIAVLKPGREYQMVGINTLEASRATRILLRTEKHLYNIGK